MLICGILLCLTISVSARADNSIESAGDVLCFALPAFTTGLSLVYKDGNGILQFGESMALSLGASYGLKYAIDEKRPNGKSYSFPSVHTSASFASAEFLRKRYGWGYGVPAYAVATFVAYSRVEAKQHYVHDVIAGAVIGIGSSYLFARPYKGWHVQPVVDARFYGVSLSRSW
jgi:membrane-associated phospholipid phosphatase